MLQYVFFILFLASVAGIVVMLYKKIPALSTIPPESLIDRETFHVFAFRMAKKALFLFSPRRLMMHAVTWTAQLLNGIRVVFLNLYHLIEALTKKARHASQKMQWEHQWFSQKEVQKHAEEKSEISEKKEL